MERQLGALGICFLWSLVLGFPVAYTGFLNTDQGTYLSVAQPLLQGKPLYLEFWDNKPPIIYLWAALTLTTGWPAQIFLLLACLHIALTALVLSRIADELSPGQPWIRRAVLFLYPLYTLRNGGWDINTETFLAPWLAFAFLCVLRSRPLLSGVAWGIAFQTKYSIIPEGLMVLGVLIYLSAGKRWKSCFLWLLGALSPSVLLIGWLAWQGSLAFYLDSNFRGTYIYATKIKFQYQLARHPAANWLRATLSQLGLWAFGLGSLVGVRTNGSGERWWIVWAWLLSAIVGVLWQASSFLHYFGVLLPPLALLASRGVVQMKRRVYKPALLVLGVIVLAPVLRNHLQYWVEVPYKGWQGDSRQQVAREIRARMEPGDKMLCLAQPTFGMYGLVGSTAPTPYSLWLLDSRFDEMLPVNRHQEMVRLLADVKPRFILWNPRPHHQANPTEKLLLDTLAEEYRSIEHSPGWTTYQRD